MPIDVAMAAPLIPNINIGVESANNPQEVATSLQVLALLTILSIAPSILIMTTSFIRIVVVLSFLRNALSTQNMPPNQVVIALSMFLTFFIMSPYIDCLLYTSTLDTSTPINQFAVMMNNRIDTNVVQQTNALSQPEETVTDYDIHTQIIDKAKLIKNNEDTQMIIKLKPEHLGDLTLKVIVEKGVVSASFHSRCV